MDLLASQLTQAAADIRSGALTIATDIKRRHELTSAAAELLDSIYLPREKILSMTTTLGHQAVVRLFVEWKVFDKIPEGEGESIGYAALADEVGADVALITIAASSFDDFATAFAALPRYFSHFGPSEPTNRLKSVKAFAEDKLGSTFWEILNTSEARCQNFGVMMQDFEKHIPQLDNYSFEWVVQEAERLGNNDEGKKRMLLPVKGALVYYMRWCLHDYSDDECVGILQQLAGAMAPDSRLLIVELLMSELPGAMTAALDLIMLTISGKERTLNDFVTLMSRAGLKVAKVEAADGGLAVIECLLA
ncbi:hypothetical protein N0V88_000139 [Collariella sp. IMI 366227]|nr:hypothetical protein N0V88_000139 [Collariella sp. IMI 366227]